MQQKHEKRKVILTFRPFKNTHNLLQGCAIIETTFIIGGRSRVN